MQIYTQVLIPDPSWSIVNKTSGIVFNVHYHHLYPSRGSTTSTEKMEVKEMLLDQLNFTYQLILWWSSSQGNKNWRSAEIARAGSEAGTRWVCISLTLSCWDWTCKAACCSGHPRLGLWGSHLILLHGYPENKGHNLNKIFGWN